MPKYLIKNGDCLDVLRDAPEAHFDSLVTDPPAGISFMGKAWDDDKGGRDQWVAWLTEVMRECHRVLKPGAHGLVWALPRTSHWTATALENAGFEIRDVVTHLFGTGFPKSRDISKDLDRLAGEKREVVGTVKITGHGKDNVEHGAQGRTKFEFDKLSSEPLSDIAKQWSGWGTALKPASEHWILVRKPLGEKTVAANVLKHGTGGINVDGCRVATGDNLNGGAYSGADRASKDGAIMKIRGEPGEYVQPTGRFPANLVLSHNDDCSDTCSGGCAVGMLDEQSGVLKSGGAQAGQGNKDFSGTTSFKGSGIATTWFGDSGGASRFFYCAKASKKDKGADNTHPTVKSTELMGYLIRLVTPVGGTVLDPFMGSGSTGVAAQAEGFGFVGIEREEVYVQIAQKRIHNS